MTFWERIIDLLNRMRGKPKPPPPPEPPPDSGLAVDRAMLLQEHNRVRATPLRLDDRLNRAAQLHAEWMAETGRTQHIGRSGTNEGERARYAGYQWRAIGENVAGGYVTVGGVMAGWKTSPGHLKNIRDEDFRDVGFGKALGRTGWHWCALFGRE